MSRIIGLDFGEKRIGVAISDESQKIALPLCVLEEIDTAGAIARIKEICQRKEVKKIVLGLPLTLEGKRGSAALKIKEFAEILGKKVNLPIFFEDERLTSKEAEKILRDTKCPKEKSGRKSFKNKVNMISAMLILKQHLEGK